MQTARRARRQAVRFGALCLTLALGASSARAQLVGPVATPSTQSAPMGGGAQTGTSPIGGTNGGAQTGTTQPNAPQTGMGSTGASGTGTAGNANQAPGSLGAPDTGSYPLLTTDRNILYPPNRDVQLGFGDLITIRLYGQPEYNPSVRIGSDGQVLLPLIGIVQLQGLSITGAEELIQQRLRDAGMYRDPQVTIQLQEGPSSFVTVVGEAHGVVPVVGSRRLLDILAAAGGLPASASHIITISRPGSTNPIVVDLGNDPVRSEAANIPVFSGDTVIVTRLGVVYVVGEFRSQGALPLSSGSALTLLEATALSGGPSTIAKYDDLRLIRTTGNQRTIVKLDIKKVMNGKAPDPILQANDILYLPASYLKSTIQNGGLNAILSLVSLAVTGFYLAQSFHNTQ